MENLFFSPILSAAYASTVLILAINSKSSGERKIEITISAIGIFLYFYWRVTHTILPYIHMENSSSMLMWIYLVVEFLSISDIFQKYAFSTRKKIKHELATDLNKNLSVDVIIPTFNEPTDLLRKTILCAKEINWGKKTVNILDDGDRKDVKQLSAELNVRYFSRSQNHGAKAGNMNSALQFLNGDFIAILDADFLAFRNFIQEALKNFNEPDVAIVQFPQTFYNPDPTQKNSKLFRKFHDEQWIWYHHVLPIRDKLNLATSCGSCSVIKRDALKLVGDRFPDDTITEDFDLSLIFLSQGKITRYVDKPVAIGLHANTVEDFFKQRKRWALGNLSAFKKAINRRDNFSMVDKISLFEWRAISLPARVITLFAPTLVLLLNIPLLMCNSIFEYLLFTMPFIYLTCRDELKINSHSIRDIFLTQGRTAGLSIALGYEIIRSAIKKTEFHFHVTKKSEAKKSENFNVYNKLIKAGLTISCLSAAIGIFKIVTASQSKTFEISLIWQIINVVILTISLKMFTDIKSPRKYERFTPKSPQTCFLFTNQSLNNEKAEIINISEGGALVSTKAEISLPDLFLELNGEIIKANIIRKSKRDDVAFLQLEFSHTSTSRDALVKEIYTGNYFPEILG